jgi:flagellar export protein FliJ
MSRRFPLQTVERLRSADLDRASGQLAAARAQVVEAEARLAGLQEQLAACTTSATTSPTEVGVAAARRVLLRENAERAQAELAGRHTQLATAVATWSAARAGLRAVESLHDRHRIAQAEADLRREQLLSDELASVLASFPRPFSGTGRIGAEVGPRPGGDAA